MQDVDSVVNLMISDAAFFGDRLAATTRAENTNNTEQSLHECPKVRKWVMWIT